jgi:hypothetical protein
MQVGHFLPWKRHLYLAHKEGRRLAVGEIYQVFVQTSGVRPYGCVCACFGATCESAEQGRGNLLSGVQDNVRVPKVGGGCSRNCKVAKETCDQSPSWLCMLGCVCDGSFVCCGCVYALAGI